VLPFAAQSRPGGSSGGLQGGDLLAPEELAEAREAVGPGLDPLLVEPGARHALTLGGELGLAGDFVWG